MTEIEAQVVQLLKSHLKAQGMTYKDLADSLAVSEVTIKRLFSRGGFEVSRLSEICKILGVDIAEAFAAAPKPEAVYHLTKEEDEYFFENPLDYGFLLFMAYRQSLHEVEKELEITRAESLPFLKRLEEMGFLELHPGDRVRLLRSSMLEAPATGKLRSAIGMQTRKDFFLGNFGEDPLALIESCQGDYSEESLLELKLDIKKLFKKAIHLHHRDASLRSDSKTTFGLMAGLRPWRWSYLDEVKTMFKQRGQK